MNPVTPRPQPTPRPSAGRGALPLALVLALLVIPLTLWLARRPARPQAESPPSLETATPAIARPDGVPPPATTPAPQPAVLSATPSNTNTSVQEWVDRLQDPRWTGKNRRLIVRQAVFNGQPEVLAAAQLILGGTNTLLKVMLAEELASSPDPQARAYVRSLVETDGHVAAAAVRGIAQGTDSDKLEFLQQVLLNEGRAPEARSEVASALGDIPTPANLGVLTNAFATLRDPDLRDAILKGVAQHPPDQTREFYTGIFESGAVDDVTLAAALKSLGENPVQNADYLKQHATDANPQVRAAVAEALYTADEPVLGADALLGWLRREPDAEIRGSLYDAMDPLQPSEVASITDQVRHETDPLTRVKGYRALGNACGTEDIANLRQFFDQQAVPDLASLAVSQTDLEVSLTSVMALQLANTPSARDALSRIGNTSTDPKVQKAAQRALQSLNPAGRP